MVVIRVRVLLILLSYINIILSFPTLRQTESSVVEMYSFKKIELKEGFYHISNSWFGFNHRDEFENMRLWKRRKRGVIELRKVGDDRATGKRQDKNVSWVRNETSANSEFLLKMDLIDSYVNHEGLDTLEDTKLLERFKSSWPVRSWSRFGLFSDDYLLAVNRHWLQFAPPPRWLNYALGSLYICLAVIGCSGNAVVLLMYYRCRSLRTPGNILVANLALSDFLMLAKTPIFIFNSFNLGPALGKTGCTLYGLVGGVTGTTSISTLAAIALDRYWAVVRPLEPLRALTAVRARLLAAAAWLYGAAFALVPALDLGLGRYVPEGYLTSCSFDYLTEERPPRYFIFAFFCAAWLLPFFTISFCYLKILRVVVYNRNVVAKNQERQLSSRHIKEQTKRKAEVKLAVLVIAVIALFFVSWTPYAVVALLGIFGWKDAITPTISMVPALFCKTAACIDPFVYIITHPNFRKEIYKILHRGKSRRSGGTFRTTVYNTEVLKHRPSRDLSDTEVEMLEMRDIPYHNDKNVVDTPKDIPTVTGRVAKRENSQKSISMKSFEDEAIPPPSWFAKPKFSKRHSFQKRSTKSVMSEDIDPTNL